ncbi:hypothetical protein D3C72_1723690 [compost metagenome]
MRQVDRFDIAADAALAEAQGHPRLEMRDQPGFDVRMRGQIKIQAIGKRIHQLAQPRRAGAVLRLQLKRVDEELHAQVAVQLPLALHFSQPSHGVDVIAFHAREIVIRLRVHQAKDSIRIRLARHMGHAPGVARDADMGGLRLPAGHVRDRNGGCRQHGRSGDGAAGDGGKQGTASWHLLLQ